MNQYIIPVPHNDPRLFSHVSHAFTLVDLGKRLLEAAKNGDVDQVVNLMNNGAPFTSDWVSLCIFNDFSRSFFLKGTVTLVVKSIW